MWHVERAAGRVGDEPLAALDDGRHRVGRRQVGVPRPQRPVLAQPAHGVEHDAPSSRSRSRRRPGRGCAGAMPACPARPCTVIRGSRLPRQAIQTSKPLGSGTIAPSARSACAIASPPAPVDSSSVTVFTIRSPCSGTPSDASTSAASTMQATPPFMSQVPRPCTAPSATTASNGSCAPAVARLDRDHVDVAVEEQRATAAAAGEPRRQLRPAGEREAVRHHRVPGERGSRRAPRRRPPRRRRAVARPASPAAPPRRAARRRPCA